jgi:hypothetical protein
MSLTFNRREFVAKMTHKGFDTENTGSGHLGLFLLDEHMRRTPVRTGVSHGGHGQTMGIPYIRKMAKHLHVTPKELNLYQECNLSHDWLLGKLRTEGWLHQVGD